NAPHGELREVSERDARPGASALRQRSWPAHLSERFPGSVGPVERTPQDDHQRIPPEPGRSTGPGDGGSPNGRVFLRGRRGVAAGVCSAEEKRLIGHRGTEDTEIGNTENPNLRMVFSVFPISVS